MENASKGVKKSGPLAGAWRKLWGLTRQPTVRVYHGYGDADTLLVFGHVLSKEPIERDRYSNNFFRNTVSLLRLFMVRTIPGAAVRLHFEGGHLEGRADETGFFSFQWEKKQPLPPGWHRVCVAVTDGPAAGASTEGKLYHPHATKQIFVSDIDDTFLVSYSAEVVQRLRVLLTRNPRTRKTFEGVVEHYQALATSNTTADAPNPFFYVSSSEWNLYNYIKEFCRFHRLPEGVFLLSPLKRLTSFWRSGQGTHSAKYDRIARLLHLYPHSHFALLGDDTQQDPHIYADLVAHFPGRVNAVYLRQRGDAEGGKPAVWDRVESIAAAGVPVCYFRHSQDAIAHSRKIGLIAT